MGWDIPYNYALIKDKPIITIDFIFYLNMNLAVMLQDSISKMDDKSLDIFVDIQKDMTMGTLHHLKSIETLNIYKLNVLNGLSQMLLYCIKPEAEMSRYFVHYYTQILSHIIKSFGEKSAMDGFIRCWINDDKNNDDLCSFMHLITRYNVLDLMKQTITLFPNQYNPL